MSVLLSASAARLQRAPSPCSRTSRSWECVLTAAIRAPDPPALAISCLSWAARLHSAAQARACAALCDACVRMPAMMAVTLRFAFRLVSAALQNASAPSAMLFNCQQFQKSVKNCWPE